MVATSGVWLLYASSTFLGAGGLFSGSQAAGAAGCQHRGREDGEQDADSGDWTWHGQHHISELHGFPGGNSQGKYSAQRHIDHWGLQKWFPTLHLIQRQSAYRLFKPAILTLICSRNGQRNSSTLHLICWYRTHPGRPVLRKRMSSMHTNTTHAFMHQSLKVFPLNPKRNMQISSWKTVCSCLTRISQKRQQQEKTNQHRTLFSRMHAPKWVNKHTCRHATNLYEPCSAHTHKPKQEERSCFSQLHNAALGFKLTKGTVPHNDAE